MEDNSNMADGGGGSVSLRGEWYWLAVTGRRRQDTGPLKELLSLKDAREFNGVRQSQLVAVPVISPTCRKSI